MSDKKTDFENNLKELEKIISELESGECSLEKSIALFEKGISYTDECRKALEKAEHKIISLTEAEGEAQDID